MTWDVWVLQYPSSDDWARVIGSPLFATKAAAAAWGDKHCDCYVELRVTKQTYTRDDSTRG